MNHSFRCSQIQKYTYDENSCPQRVKNIRGMIVELDKQIEEVLKDEVTDS